MQLSTVAWSLAGGALIGISASMMLLFNGRVCGISGIVGALLSRRHTGLPWQVLFLLGLVLGGVFMFAVRPTLFSIAGTPRSFAWISAAGLLVGVGTRLGNGCTSGHGVCGVSRFSRRSLVATAVFMATGIATVALLRLVERLP